MDNNARNLISHGYDEIQNERIWVIIVNSLPVLKEEVEGLMKGCGEKADTIC
ncbi:MAG: DUF86 domain-containing protein [Bacteroidales bacterium]|jgi:uncharacterized protein with HEPN domain|nr:DUF86 domain-containing protein [Bacteroidales bacterium]